MPETSQLICYANQLTGFYMRGSLAFNGLIKILVLWFLFHLLLVCPKMLSCNSRDAEGYQDFHLENMHLHRIGIVIYFCEVF